MSDFPPALPHGRFVEAFPDVFVLTGRFKMGAGFVIPRNMTVVRQGRELTVINSVRLTPEGEAELEQLGEVKHLLRIGAAHGADDPYYVSRYRPTLWAPPRTRHYGDLKTDEALTPGHSPIAGATVFNFEATMKPESILVLDGGIMVSCDSFQHWTSTEGASLLAKVATKALGFGPTVIGAPWVKMMGPAVRLDFARLLEVEFRHLIPGHGAVLRDAAKDGLRFAIRKRFAI